MNNIVKIAIGAAVIVCLALLSKCDVGSVISKTDDGPAIRQAIAQCRLKPSVSFDFCMQAKGFIYEPEQKNPQGNPCSWDQSNVDAFSCYRRDQ